ncbi:MAG TPA: hypothetical protein VIY27_12290 [Myxococcota bacterium]
MPGKPQRAVWLVEALLLATVAYAVADVAYLPTHDGPQHIFTLHAANHLDDPETGWGRWLEPNTPLSSHGFSAIFSPLDLWLPWPVAARVALALLAVAWALGAFAFVRAVRPERSWLGVALGATALQWSLYMGFFSFYAAGAFGLFVLALAFRSELRSRRVRALLGVLLFLQALLHVMAALLSGLVVAALCALRASPGRRLAEVARVALLGAPAACVAAAVWWVQSTGADLPAEEIESFVLQRPPWWTLGKCLMGGPAWRAWPITALAVAALSVALWGPSRRAEDRALLLAGGAFLAAGAALPLHLPSWHFFSVRFLPLAACTLVAALPLERVRAPLARRGLAFALAALAFASSAWAIGHNRDLATRSAAALAGLEVDLVRDGPRLPIILDPLLGRPFDNARADMPYTAPLLNLGKLYAAAQGGIVPFAFVSNPAIHPLLARPEAQRALEVGADPRYAIPLADPRHAGDLALREAVTVYMAAHATRFQDVIFHGEPEDVDHLLWLGFEADWRRDGSAIARFRGCPLDVRFPPDSGLGGAERLELGWYPAYGVTHRYDLSRARRDSDGGLRLPLRQSCGAVWLRFEDAALRCEGADSERRFVIPEVRAAPEVECRVRRGTAVE